MPNGFTRHLGRKRLMGLVLLLVAGFAALNLLAYNHARAMLCFTHGGGRTSKPEELAGWAKLKVLVHGVNVPRPESDLSAGDLDPGCGTLAIPCPRSISLAAWHFDRGEEAPLIILFHGYSTDKTSLLKEAKTCIALGASVLLVDFRGSGGSSEAYTTVGVHESDDVAAVVEYAHRNLPHASLVLFGQSMGGVAVLRAVQMHGIEPDGVILEAVFDTMLKTVCNRFGSMGLPAFPAAHLLVFWGGRQWGFNGFKNNPVDYATALNCPALFMHGADDPRAELPDGKRVFNAAPEPKTFVEFPDVGHEAYVSKYPEKWKAAVSNIVFQAGSTTE